MTPPALEDLLQDAIQASLAGRTPDVQALAGGDARLAARLRESLDLALSLVPASMLEAGPRQIGPWLIERELGRGGMGTVYAAVHATTGREAAVKVLPQPLALLPEQRERFRREAFALSRLSHRNVVPWIEEGDQDGVPYVAMERIDGGSLEDVLRELRGLPVPDARLRGRELLPGEGNYEQRVALCLAGAADGLHAAHAAGIVHRDVKPGNILLAADGRAVISDFGLARQDELATLTQSSVLLGTRQYLAPELCAKNGVVTPAADIYGLGVTLYELLTLRRPFAGDSEETLFRAIREQEPRRVRRINRAVSRDLDSVVLRTLEKNPSRRYRDAAELAEDLRAAAGGIPVRAPRRPAWRSASRMLLYHRRRVIGVLVMALLAAAAGVAGSIREQKLRDARLRFHRVLLDAQGRLFELASYGAAEKDTLKAAVESGVLAPFEECAEIDSTNPDLWFLRAEALRRIDLADDATKALDRAVELGAAGWHVDALRLTIAGAAPPPPWQLSNDEFERLVASLPPIGRVFLAWLINTEAPGHAVRVLDDAALLTHPYLGAEFLYSLAMHHDVFDGIRDVDPTATIYQDPVMQVRVALNGYESFSRRIDVQFERLREPCCLIRDAINAGFDLGPHRDEYRASAHTFFEEQVKVNYSSLRIGDHFAMMRADGRYPDVLAYLDRHPGTLEKADFHAAGRAAIEVAFVAERKYSRAIPLLRKWPYPYPKAGPALNLVRILERINEKDGTKPEAIEALAQFLTESVASLDPGDHAAARDLLEETRSQIAPANSSDRR